MEPLGDQMGAGKGTPIWKSPAGWLQEKKLGRGFWIFFTAAFFFDFGFASFCVRVCMVWRFIALRLHCILSKTVSLGTSFSSTSIRSGTFTGDIMTKAKRMSVLLTLSRLCRAAGSLVDRRWIARQVRRRVTRPKCICHQKEIK